ncbi:MAG TPA: ion transporter [Candidatus Paceibacterota bacterium]
MKKRRHIKKARSPIDPFDDPSRPLFRIANNVLAIATIASVAAIALETVATFQKYHLYFLIIEYISVVLFSAEYIARLVFTKHRLGYVFSFFGIIDLVAIIPSLLGLSNLTFLKSARVIRIIRLLRMLRLAKFGRAKDKDKASKSLYKINLEIYFITFLLTVLVLGSLFYAFEGHGHAKDIPTGMYWAFKAILGGITYPQPETLGGTITLILARFTAMILLGMMLGLVGVMVRRLLIGSEKD